MSPGTRKVQPCSLEWKSGQPCQDRRRRMGAMRFRTLTSSVPGGISFLGFARFQYHFGQSTLGVASFGEDFEGRGEEAETADGVTAVQSSWPNQGSSSKEVTSEIDLARSKIRVATS